MQGETVFKRNLVPHGSEFSKIQGITIGFQLKKNVINMYKNPAQNRASHSVAILASYRKQPRRGRMTVR